MLAQPFSSVSKHFLKFFAVNPRGTLFKIKSVTLRKIYQNTDFQQTLYSPIRNLFALTFSIKDNTLKYSPHTI